MSKKLFYILTSLIFAIPLLSSFIYIYVSSNENLDPLFDAPVIIFPDADRRYNYITDPLDYWSVDIVEKKLYIHADKIIFNSIEISDGTVVIDIPEFFIMGRNFYSIDEEGNLKPFDAKAVMKNALFENSFYTGLSSIITLTTLACMGVMVVKKMDLLKRHRRLTVLITAWATTMVFLILSMITNQIFLIMIAFSFSWTLYYIEWLIYRKTNGLPLHDQISQRVVITNE
jgi:hypothetical protein